MYMQRPLSFAPTAAWVAEPTPAEVAMAPARVPECLAEKRWPMTADSSRPETISHLRKHGFPHIHAAVKGARSVVEGVEFLKGYDIVVHPRCTHTIDELTHYSYKTDPLTGTILPEPEDKKNHVIDALRYACEGARRIAAVKPRAPVEVPSVVNFWSRGARR